MTGGRVIGVGGARLIAVAATVVFAAACVPGSGSGGPYVPPGSDAVVTTLAGTAGVMGSADGTGPAASFYFPHGAAVVGSGNVYVAESVNNTIRKITPAGVVTTLAGTAGVVGSADGTGPTASFKYPSGVAVDGSGNVYISDRMNSTIRKITSTGLVTTLAGTAGVQGAADGTAPAASFTYPDGVAVDGSGNVYAGDTLNNTIRKVTSAGVVTTLAGTTGVQGAADGTAPPPNSARRKGWQLTGPATCTSPTSRTTRSARSPYNGHTRRRFARRPG